MPSKSETTFRDGHQVFAAIPADAARIIFWEVDIAWGRVLIKHGYIKANERDRDWGWACVEFDPETDCAQLTGWTGSTDTPPVPWQGTFTDEREALESCRDRLTKQIERDRQRIQDAVGYLRKTEWWLTTIEAGLANRPEASQS